MVCLAAASKSSMSLSFWASTVKLVKDFVGDFSVANAFTANAWAVSLAFKTQISCRAQFINHVKINKPYKEIWVY